MKRLLQSILLAAACSSVAGNLIVNGDMKNNDGWKIWGSAPVSAAIRAKILGYVNEGPNGERVLKLDDCVNDHNPYIIQHFKVAPVQRGQGYLLKFRAKVAKGQTFQSILQCAKPGKYFGGPSANFKGTGKWASYQYRFTDVPAGTEKIGLCFTPYLLSGNNALTGSMLLADVSFELDANYKPAAVPAKAQSALGKLRITSRDLCINTALVKDGKAAAAIIGDAALAAPVIAAIKAKTGVTLSVMKADPGKGNLITIGSRDRNDFVSTLYNWHYTLLDAKYPGKGGSEVRSLHNPFGDKRNIILCGGSDLAGDKAAVQKLVKKIQDLPAGKDLTLGFIADVTLDPAYKIPADVKDAKLWESSIAYKDNGFFGWNSLSKNLALLYVTGDRKYASEFLRLAFPKDKTVEKELFKRDGEAYMDDYSDPICSVYHYCAIMMILYWDLVEEYPVWTEAERKQVNEAFYRQLSYTLTKNDYTNPHKFAARKIFFEIDRHRDWEGTALYAVARYFKKYFPCPDAEVAIRLVRNFMEPRFEKVCYGTTSRFWAHSNMEPDFFYAVFAGDRKYIGNRCIREYARDLLILSDCTSRPDEPDKACYDRNLRSSSMSSLLQIAYLTQDDAFVQLCESLPLDKTCFRLGQSFMPVKPYGHNSFKENAGKWDVFRGEMQFAKPPFDEKYVANVMSYRDTADRFGDYIMMDTSSTPRLREVERALALFNVRIDGTVVLRGHTNTMRLYADGGSEGGTRYFSKVLDYGVAGPYVYHTAMVPDYDGFDWKRTAILKKRSWLLIADEVTPKRDMASGELYNDFTTFWTWKWKALPETGEYAMSTKTGKNYLFSTSLDGKMFLDKTGWTTYLNTPDMLRMFFCKNDWKKGETLKFVTLVRPGAPGMTPSAAQQGNTAALLLPEPALFRFTDKGYELVTEDGTLTADGRVAYKTAKNSVSEAGKIIAARKVAAPGKDAEKAPAPVLTKKLGKSTVLASLAFTANGKKYAAMAAGKNLAVMDEEGKTVFERTFPGMVGVLTFQESKGRLIAGCYDEMVYGMDLSGKDAWTFRSEMAPELLKFGPYWHKSAVPGIYSLLAAKWPDRREMIFIGSEGTVEVLDADGKFLKRLYTQYGPVGTLVMQTSPARLWALRRRGGVPVSHVVLPDLTVKTIYNTADVRGVGMGFNSGVGKTVLIPHGKGFYGDITGRQNHIMFWDNSGKVLAAAELGKDTESGGYGSVIPTGRHLKYLSRLNDGTISAVTRRARAFFWTPELKLKKMIVLPAVPYCGTDDGKVLFAGFADGTIRKIAPDGSVTLIGRMPAAVRTVLVTGGRLAAGDAAGNFSLFLTGR